MTVAMTWRLAPDQQAALRERVEAERISMQQVARRAVRRFVARSRHEARVSASAERVIASHRDALDRLG